MYLIKNILSRRRTIAMPLIFLGLTSVAYGNCHANVIPTEAAGKAYKELLKDESKLYLWSPYKYGPVSGDTSLPFVVENAEEVNPTKYPSIFLADKELERCTVTLVGPATLMMAAHCTTAGAPLHSITKIIFDTGNGEIHGLCKKSSKYFSRENDIALCGLEFEVKGQPFENIDVFNPVKERESVALVGAGCSEKSNENEYGTLREGKNKVTLNRPQNLSEKPNGFYVVGNQADAILCKGDSGGPTFRLEQGNKRYIVGINSETDGFASSFFGIASTEGKRFIKEWVDFGEKICGFPNKNPGISRKECR